MWVCLGVWCIKLCRPVVTDLLPDRTYDVPKTVWLHLSECKGNGNCHGQCNDYIKNQKSKQTSK